MLKELQRRNFSAETVRGYVGAVERFAHFSANRQINSVPTTSASIKRTCCTNASWPWELLSYRRPACGSSSCAPLKRRFPPDSIPYPKYPSRRFRRAGRFHDADESAYYEYICRRANVGVQYCAEQFENDGSAISTMLKGFKRFSAGEYSRELSVKVFHGQCRLVELGFHQVGILPLRQLKPGMRATQKYQQILASVREVGIIEPIIVFPQDRKAEMYILLDGHLRLEVLKELGQTSARCLISTDDEAYTYNKRVSKLATVQEHVMVLNAIRDGHVGEPRNACAE